MRELVLRAADISILSFKTKLDKRQVQLHYDPIRCEYFTFDTVIVISWFTQMMIKEIDNNIYLLKIYLHVFIQTRLNNKNLKQFLCLVIFFLLLS